MNTYPSPLEMLYKWEQETPNKLYMRQPINGEWHHWTWSETATQVRKMAAYLKSLDFPANTLPPTHIHPHAKIKCKKRTPFDVSRSTFDISRAKHRLGYAKHRMWDVDYRTEYAKHRIG